MLMAPMSMMMVVYLFLLCFLGLLATFVDDFDVIVEDSRDHGNHVGFNDTGAHILSAPDTDVDNALESQVPFPHAHHILAAPLFEDAHQALDAAIDGEDVTDAGGGRSKIGEMIQRVDERKGRGTVEGSTIV